MSLFSPEELARFAKHDSTIAKRSSAAALTKPKNVCTNSHQRGYVFGDLRCCRCLKWLNENIPEEKVEIRYGKGKHRYHDKCPIYSPYTATLIANPKFHGTRRKLVNNAKRY
jgi:hypothetical protein